MLDTVFLGCAVVGGGVFGFRMLLQLLGVGAADPDDAGADIDDVHADADAGFRLLSIQGLTAFLMMFGLVGLALVRQSEVGPTPALLAAVVAGVVCVAIISKLFAFMGRLQSSGTMKMSNAIGQEGVVYLTVGAQKTGKVQVEVQGRLGVFDAQSVKEDIATGARVRVVSVAAGGVLVVEAV